MDPILLFHSLIMGLVEGITEFLPISSTGHLILTGDLLNFLSKDKRNVYEIFIQLGAMLAVIWEYRAKIGATFQGVSQPGNERNLLLGIVIAFIPAAIMGKLFSDQIKAVLFNPIAVSIAFIVGGFIILWAEKRQHKITVPTVDDISLKDAIKVGLCQCLALIPGTSRSGATIIGGMFLGLSRKAATEFSFFLGIPTLGAASIYSLIKHRHVLDSADFGVFAVGFVSSFIFAFIAIRALIKFISTHTFIVFAWYRIAFGLIVLATWHFGWVNWNAG
ncbi:MULTISPECIES: undecaprenyl-diphosphate phosphatase [Deefgea]|uniref:Undecaprenyl-diphosphatase n=1 Tax=Deefgea chitinilytica TaxID=570276 RepID=A0ABS2CEW6_9NEIS|nr:MULTISPECIES: undecaprenyl-diphosphate phosphatase [Deefgea]MBM5572215.1 undecaprenyl-diphosphate phosphatase [Deefgea chitinilytica]MBM9889450.1 undecaprenyl-diphosphate phosphatase [Deefgea sp. CFH1-16]